MAIRWIVAGGELKTLEPFKPAAAFVLDDFREHTYRVVGAYPSEDEAIQAWSANSRATVDNAHMRFFIQRVDQDGFVVSA